MKKFAIIALSALLVLSFAGCKAEKKAVEKNDKTPSAVDTLPDETPEKEEEPALELNIKPLEETDEESLAAAAESLGFSSIHYFSRVFKNITGISPSQYAKSVLR